MKSTLLCFIYLCLTISYLSAQSISESIKLASSGDPKLAADNLKSLIVEFGDIDSLNLGMIYYLIAARYNKIDQCDSVNKYVEICNAVFEAIGYIEYRYPTAYLYKGGCSMRLNRLNDAIQFYKEALGKKVQGQWAYNAQNVAAIELCKIYRSQGNYQKANIEFDTWFTHLNFDSIDVSNKADGHLTRSLNLASIHAYDQALLELEKLNELIPSFEPDEQKKEIALYLNQKGIIYDGQSDKANLLDAFEQLVDHMEASGYIYFDQDAIFKAYSNCAAAHIKNENFEEALVYSSRAKELLDEFEINNSFLRHLVDDNIASSLLKLKRYDEANELIDNLLGSKEGLGIEDIDLMNLYYDKSRVAYEEFLDSDEPRLLDSAKFYVIKAIETVDRLINEKYFNSSIINLKRKAGQYYDLLADISFSAQDLSTFWISSEKSKGLLLHESIRNRQYSDHNNAEIIENNIDSLNRALLPLEYDLRNTDQKEETAAISKEIAKLNKNILQSLEQLKELEIVNPLEVLSLNEVRINKEAILIYKFGETDLYGAVIQPSGQSQIMKLIDRDSLKKLLFEVNNLFSDKTDSEFLLSKLHDYLIAPLGIQVDKIVIIPDGELSMLPFEALMNTDSHKNLIQQYEMSYLVSYSSRSKSKPNLRGTVNILAPTYDSEGIDDLMASTTKEGNVKFNYLAYSKEELSRIQQTLGARASIIDFANKKEVNSFIESSKIFHFTGHAYQDPNDDRFSFLALDDRSDNLNSILTSVEIEELNTQADMVVLNACNTGLGKIVEGEGVLSLARSFLKSGAHSVLNSLWSIDDQSSSSIMINFYDNIKDGQSKSEALRNAKLKYLELAPDHKRHPYYWAGLILVGDDSPIDLSQGTNYAIWLIPLSLLILVFIVSKKYYSKLT